MNILRIIKTLGKVIKVKRLISDKDGNIKPKRVIVALALGLSLFVANEYKSPEPIEAINTQGVQA